MLVAKGLWILPNGGNIYSKGTIHLGGTVELVFWTWHLGPLTDGGCMREHQHGR